MTLSSSNEPQFKVVVDAGEQTAVSDPANVPEDDEDDEDDRDDASETEKS